ncbi:MAG: deoxycytidine deaminase [Candidatus Nanosalina sp. J07AB43]|nr:MAG: deoxycytidine deaminase [Candidatus Nanosalina sp. J07AB43]
MKTMPLNKSQLKEKIKQGLIKDYVDLDRQLQPSGFDVTVDKIKRFESRGSLDFSNSERRISEASDVVTEKRSEEDKYGWWNLDQGAYKIVMNERVDIPNDLVAFGYPRSSLLRMGCTIENAVWDPGFTGVGSFLLLVENPDGVDIKQNARVNQLVFHDTGGTQGYQGKYTE